MTDHESTSNVLMATDPTPIAQLSPELPDLVTRMIYGEITLTWPFSVVTKSIAFKLVETDFRLRHDKGQVRIEFHGPAGKAIAKASIGGGDEVGLSMDGVEWEKPSQTTVRPDTLEWQLKFTKRLRLRVRRAQSLEEELIHIDESVADDEPSVGLPIDIPPELSVEIDYPSTPAPNSTNEPITLPRTVASALPNKRLASSVFESDEYASPAFLKRARVSYGSLFEGGLDIFNEEKGKEKEKKKAKSQRKRSRFSIDTNWRYDSRSPSPEPEHRSDEEELELKVEMQYHDQTPDNSMGTPLRTTMVDGGCQTLPVDTTHSISVQVSAEARYGPTYASETPTPMFPPRPSAMEAVDSYVFDQPSFTPPGLPFGFEHAVTSTPTLDTHYPITNGAFHNDMFGASIDPGLTEAEPCAAPTTAKGLHTEEHHEQSTDSHFYNNPLNTGHSEHPQNILGEHTSIFPSLSDHLPHNIEPFPPPPIEHAGWAAVNPTSAYSPVPTHKNDIENPVVLGSSSPVREPSSDVENGAGKYSDRLPESPEIQEEPNQHCVDDDEDEALAEDRADLEVDEDESEDESEQGADLAVEDYNLRNYDRSQVDDIIQSEEDTDSDKNNTDEQVVDLNDEKSDQSDTPEEDLDSEEAGYLSEATHKSRIHDAQGGDDYEDLESDDSYESEEVGVMAYGSGEYEDDEDEDGEDNWEGEDDAQPAAPKDPVFISLLSDSEDEDEELAAPAPKQVNPPSYHDELAIMADKLPVHAPEDRKTEVEADVDMGRAESPFFVQSERHSSVVQADEEMDEMEESPLHPDQRISTSKMDEDVSEDNESLQFGEKFQDVSQAFEGDCDKLLGEVEGSSEESSFAEAPGDEPGPLSTFEVELKKSDIMAVNHAESEGAPVPEVDVQEPSVETEITVLDSPQAEDNQFEAAKDSEADDLDKVGDESSSQESWSIVDTKEVDERDVMDFDAPDATETEPMVVDENIPSSLTGSVSPAVERAEASDLQGADMTGSMFVEISDQLPTASDSSNAANESFDPNSVHEEFETRPGQDVPSEPFTSQTIVEEPTTDHSVVQNITEEPSLVKRQNATVSETSIIEVQQVIPSSSSESEAGREAETSLSGPMDASLEQPRQLTSEEAQSPAVSEISAEETDEKSEPSDVFMEQAPLIPSQETEQSAISEEVGVEEEPRVDSPTAGTQEFDEQLAIASPTRTVSQSTLVVEIENNLNEDGQLETSADTLQVENLLVCSDKEGEMSSGDYSVEQQIMEESQVWQTMQDDGTRSSHKPKASPAQSEYTDFRSEKRGKGKPERDILITVQSLRSWDHRMSVSSEGTSDQQQDPSIMLAKAPGERLGTPARLKENKTPATVRVTRSQIDHSDPSLQLARAPQTPTIPRRRDVTPESTRETRSMSLLGSKTPDPTADFLESPSTASRSPVDEQVSSLKIKLTRELREALPDFQPLKAVKYHLHRTVDVMGIATTRPVDAHRPRSGPRDYMMEVTLTDTTAAPSGVIAVHIFRPHASSMPTVEAGDIVLFRRVQVVALRKRGFGLRTGDASAWAVFEKNDEEMLPQIKGPPVESSEEELAYAEGLRKWWGLLDEKTKGKIARATEKSIQAGKDSK